MKAKIKTKKQKDGFGLAMGVEPFLEEQEPHGEFW